MWIFSLAAVLLFSTIAAAIPPQEDGNEADDLLDIPAGSNGTLKSKFIIDTDAGVDDALAILYLLNMERVAGGVKIVAITTVTGNTVVQNVLMNVLRTLKTANRLDIPVYRGLNESLLFTPAPQNFYGADGFGDTEFDDPLPADLVQSKHAVNAMVQRVRKRPGEISLLCLAPLTNVAMAIRMYPDFLKDLKEIYVLGGSVEGRGNVKPGVEFNFYQDSEAARIVFEKAEEQGKMIVLMPWEAIINRNHIDMDWRKNVLGALKSPAMDMLNKAERISESDEELWLMADPMLVAVAGDKSLVRNSMKRSVKVEVGGLHSRGAVLVDYMDDDGFVDIVDTIDTDAYKKYLLDYMDLSTS